LGFVFLAVWWLLGVFAYAPFIRKALQEPLKEALWQSFILQFACMLVTCLPILKAATTGQPHPWWLFFAFFSIWAAVATLVTLLLLRVRRARVNVRQADWVWLGHQVIAIGDATITLFILPLLVPGLQLVGQQSP
jgi:hypothetical protein